MSGLDTAGGLASGVLGYLAQQQNERTNSNIQSANLAQESNDSALRRSLAQRLLNMQMEGQTDANGNSVKYVPGQGWVQTLGGIGQSINDASNKVTLDHLQDNLREEQGKADNAKRRGAEGLQADAYLAQVHDATPQQTNADARNEQLLERSSDVNDAYDRSYDRAATQALRSGASNGGQVLRAINNQRSKAVGQSGSGVRIDNNAAIKNASAQQASNATNLYNTFASRAGNVNDTQFAPSNIATNLSREATSMRDTLPQAFNINNLAASGPTQKLQQTDNSLANLVGGSLDNVGGYFDEQQGQSNFNSLMQALQKRQLGNQGGGNNNIQWDS